MPEVIITMSSYRQKKCLRFYLKLFFHVLAFCVYVCVSCYAVYLWYLFLISDINDPLIWNIKWFTPCYVTNWNFILQTCFLTLSLVYDMLEWMDRHDSTIARRLKYCTSILFSGLIVPLTTFISTFFWIIYWVDRELVFPKIYDQLVPWWFNHCVHTNIVIVLALETLLQARRHPANLKVELWLTGIAGVSYAVVYYSIFFFAHRWLYGVFGIMTWWQVCIFQLLIWAYMFIAYGLQFPINRIFHGEELDTSEEKSRFQNPESNKGSNNSASDFWNTNLGSKFQMESSAL